MSKDFAWTDEFILEFVRFTNRDAPAYQGRYADLEQFKQSKQNSNKDWMIIERNWEVVEQGDNAYDIKSVRRISDGEIISVGDKIKYGNKKDFSDAWDGVIVNIHISHVYKNEIIFIIRDEDGEEREKKFISNIQKAKQKLFTTLDGKDIYEGDEYWYADIKQSSSPKPEKLNAEYNGTYGEHHTKKTFSTEAAAKDYILMHNPCLSLDDLLSVWADGDMYKKSKEYYADAPLFLNFKRLANKKLNDSNR